MKRVIHNKIIIKIAFMGGLDMLEDATANFFGNYEDFFFERLITEISAETQEGHILHGHTALLVHLFPSAPA